MPGRVTVEISRSALIELGASPAGPIFRHMLATAAKIETLAKTNASGSMVGVRSGTLRSSIHTVPPVMIGDRLVVVIAADAAYARFVHEGTRAHTIEAAPGRVLAWEGPDGPAFATRVNIPAQPPRPFLRDALYAVIH